VFRLGLAHLTKLYQQCPDQFTPLLPRFLQLLKSSGSNMGEKMMTVQVYGEMVKKQPEVGAFN
jgi:hypothetical protein